MAEQFSSEMEGRQRMRARTCRPMPATDPTVPFLRKWREMEGEAKGEIGGTYRKSVLTIAWGWVKDGAAPPCDAILALPLASAAFSSEANF